MKGSIRGAFVIYEIEGTQMADKITESETAPAFTQDDFIVAMFGVLAELVRETTKKDFRMKVVNSRGDHIWVDSQFSIPAKAA